MQGMYWDSGKCDGVMFCVACFVLCGMGGLGDLGFLHLSKGDSLRLIDGPRALIPEWPVSRGPGVWCGFSLSRMPGFPI